MELLVQLNGARNRQAVTEYQRLGFGVDPVVLVVRDHALAPAERVTAVMAGTVKQLAKIQVKVAQKGIEAVHIAQRNAQVAPVLLGPRLKGKHLAVAQTRAQGLAGLQVLVRHGAQGRRGSDHRQEQR